MIAIDTQPLVSVNSVSKFYGNKAALDNLTFTLLQRQITFLIGPNGAGKSTLAKILVGIQLPSGGSVQRKPRMTCRYLPQKPTLNTYVPLSAEALIELVSGCKALKQDICQRFGIQGILSLRLSELSGGQLQKVLIAANVLARPDLLVLDEPMDGLDIECQAELHKLVPAIRAEFGTSIVLISHDLHTIANYSDQTLCLDKVIRCHGIGTPDGCKKSSLTIYTHQHALG